MAAGVAAVGGSNLQIVIIVDVAGRTGNVGVAIGEKESGRAVIKDGGGPANGVMAGGAVGRRKRRSCRWVHRIVRSLPSREVASGIPAIRRLDGQAVVIVDVARSAGWHQSGGRQLVGVGQRKARGSVVKGCIGPKDRIVARRAQRGREARGDVVRHAAAKGRRTLPGRLVAAVTIGVG